MTQFSCQLDAESKPLRHVWNHTVGSGRAALALRADWREQMTRTRRELGVEHVRFHGILCDEMATYIIECDKPVHSFSNADQIFDFLLSIGMRPFVELSFMPTALQSGGTTVFKYRANVTPPRDWDGWAALITKLVSHWVDRYGIEEVRQWYFEVWNEPNLGAFWTGTQADYFKLYQRTVQAVRDVDAQLRVGGPATADDAWIDEFLEFCDKNQLPADFVSTHHYPTDALGKPGDNTETQLSLAPRNYLRDRARKAAKQAGDKPVYYTEWCSSSNPFFHRHDEPYAAAFLTKNMLDVVDVVHGYSWWTFSDIFEENYFSSIPFHGGFGLQTVNGTAKPTYRAMQLLNHLGERILDVEGAHATVNAWVTRKGADEVCVMLTNHAFPTHAIQSESICLRLTSVRKPLKAWVERIDEDHCNPVRAWQAMDSPDFPSAKQLAVLDDASQLRSEPLEITTHADGFELQVNLPAHAVAALHITLAADPAK
ncbi:MAG: glycosyl hydrolase [Xanthomonadales bacterium]|nr:glycosyl hydrolase [Xanthomonadales bacterium]